MKALRAASAGDASPRFRSVRFYPDSHATANFHCGQADLDSWLHQYAAHSDHANTSRVWVWIDENVEVRAYYSISAHKITRATLPSRLGRGAPAELPAVLIGKLALDATLQGHGLGSALLADALQRIVQVSRQVAVKVVVVDALNDSAAGFYQAHGFQPTRQASRLILPISRILASMPNNCRHNRF